MSSFKKMACWIILALCLMAIGDGLIKGKIHSCSWPCYGTAYSTDIAFWIYILKCVIGAGFALCGIYMMKDDE